MTNHDPLGRKEKPHLRSITVRIEDSLTGDVVEFPVRAPLSDFVNKAGKIRIEISSRFAKALEKIKF